MAEANTSDTQNNENTPTKAKYFRYPLRQIKSNTDYLEISVVKYSPPGLKASDNTLAETGQGSKTVIAELEKNPQKQFLGSICLPIPQNISDANSVTWGDETLNPLQAFGLSATKATLEDLPKAATSFMNKIASSGNALLQDPGTRNLITAAIGGTLANRFGGNVSYNSVLSRATGQVFNSNLELLFSGPNIRTFPFIFDFIPRDRRESEEVKSIIRTFKKHMSSKDGRSTGGPNITRGIFLESPDVFLLKYKTGNKAHPFLNKFKPCALVDMNVNYTASGTYATYQDSTPVHLQMTLTFRELNPIYASDYEDKNSKGGVGY